MSVYRVACRQRLTRNPKRGSRPSGAQSFILVDLELSKMSDRGFFVALHLLLRRSGRELEMHLSPNVVWAV